MSLENPPRAKELPRKNSKESKEVVYNTKEKKKELLEDQIKKGIPIQNQKHYESLMKLLQKNHIITSFPSFTELNDLGEGSDPKLNHFVLQKDIHTPFITVFLAEIERLTYPNPSGIHYQLGTIDENGTFKKDPSREKIYPQIIEKEKTPSGGVKKFDPSQDSIELVLGVMNEKEVQKWKKIKPKTEKGGQKYDIYTVKDGDNLWNIIRNKYGWQKNTSENNTLVANMVRAVLQKNPHIKDANKIYAKQKISFPQKSHS